jgi:hypothetical protein
MDSVTPRKSCRCSTHWAGAFNELVEDFDLELLYNIAPMESDHTNS